MHCRLLGLYKSSTLLKLNRIDRYFHVAKLRPPPLFCRPSIFNVVRHYQTTHPNWPAWFLQWRKNIQLSQPFQWRPGRHRTFISQNVYRKTSIQISESVHHVVVWLSMSNFSTQTQLFTVFTFANAVYLNIRYHQPIIKTNWSPRLVYDGKWGWSGLHEGCTGRIRLDQVAVHY